MSGDAGAAAPAVPRASKTLVWGLVAIALVAIAVRLVAIRNTWGIGQDQYTYLETARIFRDGEWRERWTFRFLHPLYPMLIALVDPLVRDMDLTSRLISLVATVSAGAGLGLWWGRRRGAAEGLAIAAAFALNPGPVLVGTEALTEGLTLPVAAWTFLVCARLRGRVPTNREAALAGLLFGVLILIKTTCALMIPGALVAAMWPVLWPLRGEGIRRILAPVTVFAAVTIPMFLAPSAAEWALTGKVTNFVTREANVTDAQVLGKDIPTVVASDTGETEQEHFEFGEHSVLRKFGSNVASIFTWRGARHFGPSYAALAVVPLTLIGIWSILRTAGAARDLWIVTAGAIGFEWFGRCWFVLVDRYLVPGTLFTLVAAAVGAVALVRLGTERVRRGGGSAALVCAVGLACAGPGAASGAYWVRSFWRQSVEPGRRPIAYQEVGKLARALGDARPRTLVTLDSQVCWFAGAQRMRMPKGGMDAVAAFVERSGCDAFAVGPGEWDQNPELRTLLDLPVGATWRNFRVVARWMQDGPVARGRCPGATILQRTAP